MKCKEFGASKFKEQSLRLLENLDPKDGDHSTRKSRSQTDPNPFRLRELIESMKGRWKSIAMSSQLVD